MERNIVLDSKKRAKTKKRSSMIKNGTRMHLMNTFDTSTYV